MAIKKQPKVKLETMRHSASHLMAAAMQLLYPKVRFAIGPAISDGFYYDFDLPAKISNEDLPRIEETMRKLAEKKLAFKKKIVSTDEASKIFQDLGQTYKVELVKELKEEKEKKVNIYKLGEFLDLCRGPHVSDTEKIGSFKLISVAGAYWKGEEKNKMLTRIYGVCFVTKKELEQYLIHLEEAKKRDHRVLGRELELFVFDKEVGKGLPLYLPKGALLRQLLIDFALKTYLQRGYELVSTPHIGTEALWKHSGHLDFYSESMYGPMEIEGEKYRLKPMNCPFHVKMYNFRQRSYRELPIRWTEMGTVYRFEKSGELHGITRPRGFTQDDAHIICTEEQLEKEIIDALNLTIYMFKTLKMENLIFKLSVRDQNNLKKYFGNDKGWIKAEKSLRKALSEIGHKNFEVDIGGAVFYAPKIDIDAVDSMGRRWQLSTIQIDFNLPSKFKMYYVDKDGKKKTPFMIHRALLGSLERFMGVYIEHTAGAFPVWLAPLQAMIIPISDKHISYCKKLAKTLKEEGIRVQFDERPLTTSAKIREAEIQKVPYMLIVGDKEINQDKVNVRKRGEKILGLESVKSWIKKTKEEIALKR